MLYLMVSIYILQTVVNTIYINEALDFRQIHFPIRLRTFVINGVLSYLTYLLIFS